MAKNIIRAATYHRTEGGYVSTFAHHGTASLGSANFTIDTSWCSNSSPLPITTGATVIDSHGNVIEGHLLDYGY
jgi:hypothetical protein